jgi:K+-sensing histidine kinase KdpD
MAPTRCPARPVLYVPLKAAIRIRGVLAIEPRNPARLTSPEQRRLLQTCASLLAIALERIHYVDVAQSSTVQMESERLRNSILAAISHDLRTPLASAGRHGGFARHDAPGPERRPGRDRRSHRCARRCCA